ncbi:MAG: hypothetical protein P3W91_000735 [Fervidobacterium sp.]|nr:hypothetical protein [Fervidobacterium sp.]
MEVVFEAILRKLIFAVMLFALYKAIDRFEFKAFDTDEVLKDDAKAIAILLGAIAIALALV